MLTVASLSVERVEECKDVTVKFRLEGSFWEQLEQIRKSTRHASGHVLARDIMLAGLASFVVEAPPKN